MSTEVHMLRVPNGFIPATDEDYDAIGRFKIGEVSTFKLTQMRNGKFHRKWFALAKLAYDNWAERCSPAEYKGQQVRPSFDRFRKDLTILCGHYTPVYAANGEVRLEAKSIAFASMDEVEFERLYSQTINVVLQKILAGQGYTEDKLRALVDEVLRFDSR